MKVETKFNMGDILYTLETEHEKENCPICNGYGFLTKDDAGQGWGLH